MFPDLARLGGHKGATGAQFQICSRRSGNPRWAGGHKCCGEGLDSGVWSSLVWGWGISASIADLSLPSLLCWDQPSFFRPSEIRGRGSQLSGAHPSTCQGLPHGSVSEVLIKDL